MAKEKLTKAEQIRRLREVTADEDKYFSGVLGNPVAFAARWGVPLSKPYHSFRRGNLSSMTAQNNALISRKPQQGSQSAVEEGPLNRHEEVAASSAIPVRRRPPDNEKSETKGKDRIKDPISDMLLRIRNAGTARLSVVEVPHSRVRESVAKILEATGYVSDMAVEGSTRKRIKIRLKFNGNKSVIEGLSRTKSPGLHSFMQPSKLPHGRNRSGITIVSTSEGLLTGAEAKKKGLRGDLICYIW
jgi:small subunit ribosomal protein S8